MDLTADEFVNRLRSYSSPAERGQLTRYIKPDDGGEDTMLRYAMEHLEADQRAHYRRLT